MIKADESALQKSIKEYLEVEGFTVFEFAKPGGHEALRGSVPVGWVDILAMKAGTVVFFEVKLPGKEATPKQETLHAKLRQAGCRVAVVHSVEEVQEVLRLVGFELKGELQ